MWNLGMHIITTCCSKPRAYCSCPTIHMKLKNFEKKRPIPSLSAKESQFVDYTLDFLREENFYFKNSKLPLVDLFDKSTSKSVQYRLEGNNLYYKKNLVPALWQYTRSISYAMPNSKELALAYGNRSAILFELKLSKECLEDIKNALDSNYPENKKAKILKRKEMAEKMEYKMIKFHGKIPSIDDKHRTLPISNQIKIEKNNKLGRYFVASKDIQPGEILLVEKPFSLFSRNYEAELPLEFFCTECLQQSFNLIPCLLCNTLYCSESCRKSAYKNYHRYECIVLRKAAAIFFPALQITLKGIISYETSSDYEVYKNCSDLYTKKITDWHNEIENASVAAISFYILKEHTDILAEFNIPDKENVLKSMLFHDIRILQYNFHGIDSAYNGEKVVIGIGLYENFSLFKHSCLENIIYQFYGSTVIARAKMEIKAGEQCLMNYGVDIQNHFMKRKILLMVLRGFECQCLGCEMQIPVTDPNLCVCRELITDERLSIKHYLNEDKRNVKNLMRTLWYNIRSSLETMKYPLSTLHALHNDILNQILDEGNNSDFISFDAKFQE